MQTEEGRNFPRHDIESFLKSSRGERNARREDKANVIDIMFFFYAGVIVTD